MIRWMARLLALVAILTLATALAGEARPRTKRLFVEAYPKTRGTRLDACGTCHDPAMALNPYGTGLMKANLAFASIEKEDSDKDGKSNRVEIEALSLPGDPKDKPGARRDSSKDSTAAKPDTTSKKN